MVCLSLRKLPAWLYSINPDKVKPELHDKIIQYQNECDETLWSYGNQGVAVHPGSVWFSISLKTSRGSNTVSSGLTRQQYVLQLRPPGLLGNTFALILYL